MGAFVRNVSVDLEPLPGSVMWTRVDENVVVAAHTVVVIVAAAHNVVVVTDVVHNTGAVDDAVVVMKRMVVVVAGHTTTRDCGDVGGCQTLLSTRANEVKDWQR